jgi:TRAP-type mannitol/chloroaromatic compound transport system substrate-binding protein
MPQTKTIIAAVLLGCTALPAMPAAAADNPTVTWNLSVWGPPRPFTAGIETLAKYLESETAGKFHAQDPLRRRAVERHR